MAPGRVLRPITNGLHQDHRGIRRVGDDGPARPLPLVSTAEDIATAPHPSYARACAWLVLLVVAAIAVLSAAPPAAATAAAPAVPCWKRLLNDWYDGRIDNAYPLRCYREAIAELPEDVKVYADAEEDIRRAMLRAIRQSKDDTGKEPTPQTPLKPTPKPPPPAAPATTDTNEEAAAPPVSGGPDPGDPLATADPAATTRSDSVPLPLIVLGVLALLLLAAAGAGVASKRLQTRRLTATPPPSEEPPPVA